MLEGKRGLVLGVANKRSLAWAIARACAERGAEIALTVQRERFVEPARELAATLPGGHDVPILTVDVTDPDAIEAAAGELRTRWDRLDFMVHSIAYADPAELRGRFRDTTRQGFVTALEVSAFSLIPLARTFSEMMTAGGSIVALSYLGGDKVVPNYNVMGVAKAALDAAVRYLAHDLGPHNIRVNAVAPGPVKTVSAAAIGDFGKMLQHVKHSAPLRRNITAQDVGDVVTFLVSDLASAVTGVHMPVDCGYTIMGVAKGVQAEEEA